VVRQVAPRRSEDWPVPDVGIRHEVAEPRVGASTQHRPMEPSPSMVRKRNGILHHAACIQACRAAEEHGDTVRQSPEILHEALDIRGVLEQAQLSPQPGVSREFRFLSLTWSTPICSQSRMKRPRGRGWP